MKPPGLSSTSYHQSSPFSMGLATDSGTGSGLLEARLGLLCSPCHLLPRLPLGLPAVLALGFCTLPYSACGGVSISLRRPGVHLAAYAPAHLWSSSWLDCAIGYICNRNSSHGSEARRHMQAISSPLSWRKVKRLGLAQQDYKQVQRDDFCGKLTLAQKVMFEYGRTRTSDPLCPSDGTWHIPLRGLRLLARDSRTRQGSKVLQV